MTVQEWLGADNKLSIDVWNRKYRFNNESFDEWLDRISDGNGKVRQMILDKKFLYGGRILANLNTGTKQGVSNCVTAGYVEDSLEDIMDTAKYLAVSIISSNESSTYPAVTQLLTPCLVPVFKFAKILPPYKNFLSRIICLTFPLPSLILSNHSSKLSLLNLYLRFHTSIDNLLSAPNHSCTVILIHSSFLYFFF